MIGRDISLNVKKRGLHEGYTDSVQEMKNEEWRKVRLIFFVPLTRLTLDVFEEEAENQIKKANKLLDFLMYDDIE